MYVCLSYTNVALAQDNNNLYKLCVGHFVVKADTCRWVYQKFRYTAKEISLKISCADPETFVWRAGYYRPYSGFAIEMAFCWPADCGPTLTEKLSHCEYLANMLRIIGELLCSQ